MATAATAPPTEASPTAGPWLGGSLTRKLIVVLGLVAILPLLVNAVFAGFVTSARLQEQTGSAVRGVAATTIDLATQTLIENTHLVQTLAANGQLVSAVVAANAAYDDLTASPEDHLRQRDEDWRGLFTYSPEILPVISADRSVNAAGAELHHFGALFPRHVELVLTDRYGGLLAATNRTQTFYFAEQAWWRAVDSGGTFIGSPVEDVDTGVISVILGVPVLDDNGQAIGALCSALDIREVLDILRRVELGEGGVVRLYDTDGVAIFDPTTARLGSAPLPSGLDLAQGDNGWQVAPSLEGGEAIHGWARASRTAGIAAIDQLGWTAVASQDAAEALLPVAQVIQLQVVIAAVVAVLAILAALFLTRRLTRQLVLISGLFEEIRRANYSARAEVVSRDELGRMTQALNSMLDQLVELIQSQEERDRIQRAVVKLLEEVSDVARGDLTVRAEVTPDITGAIADSFNYMIVELQRIIGNVQDTTGQVTHAAGAIRQRMEQLANGSESQSRRIRRTSEQIESMSGSIRQVSGNASRCSRVADQALHNAQQGADAVEKTVEGMKRIRSQAREASKRLKRLGESSQEIGQIVKLISEISDRTNILALNASLQAAAAGEVGESFAVVADEIERLADRSNEAAQRIDTLIKTVQVETAEAMAAMEGTTREVVGGWELANRAGQALEEIENVSGELAGLVQQIAQESGHQAQGSELLAGTMNEIAEIMQEATASTQQASEAADNLNQLADGLRDSVRRFRLPAKVA